MGLVIANIMIELHISDQQLTLCHTKGLGVMIFSFVSATICVPGGEASLDLSVARTFHKSFSFY